MSSIISPSISGIIPGVSQAVSISGTSAQSSALGSNTTAAMLCATVACFVALGTSPTAVANTSLFLPANVPVFVGVQGGHKVAVIGTSGTLYITEAS